MGLFKQKETQFGASCTYWVIDGIQVMPDSRVVNVGVKGYFNSDAYTNKKVNLDYVSYTFMYVYENDVKDEPQPTHDTILIKLKQDQVLDLTDFSVNDAYNLLVEFLEFEKTKTKS
jgi:hypothetical protein